MYLIPAFRAANIGVHIISVEFLRRVHDEGLQLPFHALERITPCLDRKKRWVEPTEKNSIGFRAFVFDAIPFARQPMVTGVRREDEFSPIKAPTGSHSPETARTDLARLHARWLAEAGRPVPGAEDPACPRPVEISPLFALDAVELRTRTIPPYPAEGGVFLGERS